MTRFPSQRGRAKVCILEHEHYILEQTWIRLAQMVPSIGEEISF